MTCQDYSEKLLDWIEGELTPAEAAAVEKHVASCPDCAHEVAEYRQVLKTVVEPSYVPEEQYFDGLFERVRERIAREAPPATWVDRLRQLVFASGSWRRPAFAALTLSLLLFGVLVGTGTLQGLIGDKQEVNVAGVEKVKINQHHPDVEPRIVSDISRLSPDEIDLLRGRIVESLLPEGAAFTGFEPNPVVSSPTFGDLSDREAARLAELVSQQAPQWSF